MTYDVRNNLINFYGDTDYKVDGGSYEGKQVSINDKSGASANIDIQVNYSLNPDAALSLYSEYGTQESFVEKYISNDVRAVTREVSGGFDTVTMLTDRSQFTKAVQKALTEKWKGIGLTVEQVSVQDVRYPKNITKSYSEAQAAEVAKQKAQNEQETAKVEAETRRSRRRARRTPTPSSRTRSTTRSSSSITSTRSRASARTATSSSCPRAPSRSWARSRGGGDVEPYPCGRPGLPRRSRGRVRARAHPRAS